MMIASKNGFASFKLLPYYTKVEYLESTGMQYIDTGYRMTSDDLRFGAEMMQKPSGNPADFFFGYRFTTAATSTGDMRAFFVFGSGAAVIGDIGMLAKRYGSGSTGTYSKNNLVMSQKGMVEYTPSNFVVNGKSTAVSTTASANPSYGNMYLFACNTTGWYSADVGKFVGSIYNFRIWQGAVLVRDFVPVRFTNELNETEGAMYDRVSGGLFRNQGSGSFIIGPDKA